MPDDVIICRTAMCFFDWLQQFQVLVAALAVIVAALIVCRCARRRAQASVTAADHLRAAQQRATATALWAELACCHDKLTTDARNLRSEELLKGGNVVLRLFRTPVFDAHPADIGALHAQDAYAVSHAYQLIKTLDDQYRDAIAAKAVNQVQIDQLLGGIDRTENVVTTALTGLRQSAQIAAERAEPTMAAEGVDAPA